MTMMCRRRENETDANEEKARAGVRAVAIISVSTSMLSAAEDDCRRDGQAIIVLLFRASVLCAGECRAEPLKSIPPKIRTGILI